MGKEVVKVQKLGLVEISMLGVRRMVVKMVTVRKITLMEGLCMWEIGRMGNKMVKEHSLSLMEKSILGYGGMAKDGTGQNKTKADWLRKLIQKIVQLIYCSYPA